MQITRTTATRSATESAPVYSQGGVQSSFDGDVAIVRIGRWDGGRYVAEHEARVRVRTMVRDAGVGSVTPEEVAWWLAEQVMISDDHGCLADTWTRDLLVRRLAEMLAYKLARRDVTLESVT